MITEGSIDHEHTINSDLSTHDHSFSLTTDGVQVTHESNDAGEFQAGQFDTRPVYYTLGFIMKL